MDRRSRRGRRDRKSRSGVECNTAHSNPPYHHPTGALLAEPVSIIFSYSLQANLTLIILRNQRVANYSLHFAKLRCLRSHCKGKQKTMKKTNQRSSG